MISKNTSSRHSSDLRSAQRAFFVGLILIAVYSLLFGLYDGFGHLESIVLSNRTVDTYRDVQYFPFLAIVPVFIGCFIISYRLLKQYVVSMGWAAWWAYVVSLCISITSYFAMGFITYYYYG